MGMIIGINNLRQPIRAPLPAKPVVAQLPPAVVNHQPSQADALIALLSAVANKESSTPVPPIQPPITSNLNPLNVAPKSSPNTPFRLPPVTTSPVQTPIVPDAQVVPAPGNANITTTVNGVQTTQQGGSSVIVTE
jgi:hypothetical protein